MILVLAPRYLHKSILKEYRQNDPFNDVKLVSKEELQKYCYVSIREEAITYLMIHHGYQYEVCKMLLEYMPYLDRNIHNFKMDNLVAIYDELDKNGYINVPSDDHNLFTNKDIVSIGYSSNDKEVLEIVNKLHSRVSFIKNKVKILTNPVLKFDKVEEEVYFVLNEIAKLLDSGVSIRNIYILKRNNEYDYYLEKYASEFGYQINLKSDSNYLSTGAFKEFKKIYEECHDVDKSLDELKALMKDDEQYQDFVDAVKEEKRDNLDYEIEKDYLYHRLEQRKIRKSRYNLAVEVITNPIYGSNNYVFTLGMAQGQFPRSIKDDKYLNDKELTEIGRNNAKEKTKIDEEILLDFFYSNNNFVFSFSKKSISGKYYLSPLVKLLKLNEEDGKLADTFYSKKVLTYIYSNLLDIDYLYNEQKEDYHRIKDVINVPYRSYDNTYSQKANAFNQDSFVKLSTTRLDLFSNCPFHYYLSKVVRFDEDESTFYIALGNITHAIFENHRKKDFDFDATFEQEAAKHEFSFSEKFLLENQLKGMILEASKSILLREKYYKNPEIFNEENVDYYLDPKTYISGKIDNLIVLDNQYLVCIDYKTGSSSSNFSESKFGHGLSTQLPTYTYLTSKSEKYKDYQVIGIYINHVIPDKVNNTKDDELIYGYLKLQGKTLGDLDAFSCFDSTIADGKSSFVSSISLVKSGDFHSSTSIISQEQFDTYKTTVESLYLDMAARIRNNDFQIQPLYFSKSDNACQYCPFKDICYVRPYQRRMVDKEEEEDE